MALNFPDNRYPGVNAHLNSYLQHHKGLWSGFHFKFIDVIDLELQQEFSGRHMPIIQLGIQKRDEDETLSGESFYICVQLVVFSQQSIIRPITQIENILPATIASQDTLQQYHTRRESLIASGVNLVEINLLGDMPLFTHSSYETQFSVIITSPKPPFGKGTQTTYVTELGEPLPTITIPFLDYEVELNLNEAYNAAFRGSRLYAMLVDYEKPPVNFNRYSVTVQQRINAILEQIRTTPA